MNISNIFGLHLGCRVKINRTGDKGKIINVSTSISNIGEGIITIEDLFSGMRTKYIKDCKLILKPLSAISEEDKAEFVEKFYPTDSLFWRYMRIVSFQASGLNVYSTRREESYSVAYTYQQALFLSTKGYKIEGIVPDEYCEVEE